MPSANTLDSAEGENIQDKSTLNLYRTLIRSNILDDVPNDYIPSSEQDIRYVVNEYKYIPEFKENNSWNKILLFEEQFQNISSATDRTSFETLIKKEVGIFKFVYFDERKWIIMQSNGIPGLPEKQCKKTCC